MAEPDFETISIADQPKTSRWKLTTLYKNTINGATLFWEVGFNGAQLEINYGHVDGAVVSDRTDVKTNSSGRDINEQALLNARQRYREKYREGYQPLGDPEPPMIKGMKGDKYEKETDIKSWPVEVQPKLDGIRMLCHRSRDGSVFCRSYENKHWTHLGFIADQVQAFLVYLPPQTTVDGELYVHGMPFTTLTSIVKTMKKVHPELQKIQYHIFDIDYLVDGSRPCLEDRMIQLEKSYKAYLNDLGDQSTSLVLVESQTAYSAEDIKSLHDIYEKQGYEGVMIKKRANGSAKDSKTYKESEYKPGRSKNILKYKSFQDEEGTVVGVHDSEGREKGAARLEIEDMRGNRIIMRFEGPLKLRKEWLKKPETVMGKRATFRYQELSEYGVPRFPVGVAIRDYE